MTMRFSIRLAAALIGAAALLAGAATAQTLDKIKQKGVIAVGVKNDYKPFGFLDPSGAIVGIEPDLAADFAQRLGVKLELVPVQSANRIEFLQQGRIDLILASMSDTPQRRQTVGVIDPPYYAGGTALITKKAAGIKQWADLKGKKVCGVQGAYYNRPVAEKYGAEIVAFAGVPEAQNALLAGSCIGFLQDSTLISAMLAGTDTKWADYTMPVPVEDYLPWVVAVPMADRDGPYGKAVHDALVDWLKSGKITELEKKWNLPPSQYVIDQKSKVAQ